MREGCGESGTLCTAGEKISAAVTENSMAVPQTIKNKVIMWSNKSTFGYLTKRTESRGLKRDLHIHVHSIICNSQKGETTQVPIGR